MLFIGFPRCHAAAAARFLLVTLVFGLKAISCLADVDPFEHRYEKIDITAHPKVPSDTKCPLGHDSIYVLPRPPSCSVPVDEPKEVWVCSKCYYQYDLKHHFWSRWGRSPKDFAIPLCEFVRLFQIEKEDAYEGHRHDQYVQHVKFGKVQWEKAFLRTNLAVEKSRDYVKATLEKHQIQYSFRLDANDAVAHFSGKWKEYEFDVSVGKQTNWPNPSFIGCEIKGKSIWEIRK